jgi:hypothetical protein
MDEVTMLRLAGLVGMFGAALYVAGDVLLLAPIVADHGPHRPLPLDVSGDRILRRRARLLEELARLPPWRLRWGALLGVFGAPLTLAGVWLFYRSVSEAGPWLALPPTLMFVAVTVIGPFVHGSFAYVGDTVQILYEVTGAQRERCASQLRRQIVTVMIAYGPLLLAAVAASVWAIFPMLSGRARVPAWMAAVNPVTMAIAWLLLKAMLPTRVGARLQGAGFSIANGAWFAALAATIR